MRPIVQSMALVAAAAGLIVACGCETTGSSRQKTEAATNAEISSLQTDVNRLRQEVEALDRELARSDKTLRTELETLRRAMADLDTRSSARVANLKDGLVKKINEIEHHRIEDKNALNKKMDAIVSEVNKALGAGHSGPSASSHSGTERGFYHTVEAGESVSAIAAKYRERYGTTVKSILDANNLTATSIIRPGDKLFIPVAQ